MKDFNKRLEKVVREQITSLKIERQSLEEHKRFRNIPFDVKQTYYKGYDYLMDCLYEMLFTLMDDGVVTLEEYNDTLTVSNALAEYLITILNSYGIKYTNI